MGHNLPNLYSILLAYNHLIGILPNSILNATQLVELDLSHNKFSGKIPNSIGDLRSLELLNIAGNNFVSDPSFSELRFFTSLTNCKNLREIWLAYNPLNGYFPVSIGNLSESVESFIAPECEIKGNIPLGIGNLSGLSFLNPSGNHFTGAIPQTLGGCCMLQILDIGKNKIGGTIPYDLCQ